jgi:PIN domain nuclease of toxin-antitoxin system
MQTDRLLLDTHVFLWWKVNDSRLVDPARTAIANAALVMVSAASAWEIAIKSQLGKLVMPENFAKGVEESGFEKLPIGFEHTQAIANLPHHHKDPFDRMLVAQAIIEKLTLVTHDRVLEAYNIPIVWA